MDNYACTNLTHRYDGVFLSMFAYCCIALLCVFVFVLGMQEFSAKLLQRIGLMSLDLRMFSRWEEMLKDGEEDIDNDSRGEDGDENKNNDTNEGDDESKDKDKDDVSHEEERDDLVDIGLTIVHEDGREEHKRGVARILKLEVVVKCMPDVNERQNSSEGEEEDKKGDDDGEDEKTGGDGKEEDGDGQKETEKETEEEDDDDEKEECEMKEKEGDDDEKEMEEGEGEEEDEDEDEGEGEEETEEEKSAGGDNAVTEVLPEIIEIVRSCTRGVAGKVI